MSLGHLKPAPREELFDDKIIILVLLRSAVPRIGPTGQCDRQRIGPTTSTARAPVGHDGQPALAARVQQLLERALPAASELLDVPAGPGAIVKMIDSKPMTDAARQQGQAGQLGRGGATGAAGHEAQLRRAAAGRWTWRTRR